VLTASGADQGTGFIKVWFSVIATRQALGGTTACGVNNSLSGPMFVALPSTGLCNTRVRILKDGLPPVDTTVQEVGPWCPNSPVPGGFNQCSCGNDRYWNRDGVPLVVTMTCDTNDAGMDLSDALARQLGVNRGPILWRFR